MTGSNAGKGVQPVLKIDNLSVELPKGADRQHAVENVSLEVRPGEILCLVGESGSGKSVTGLSIMGLLPKGQLTPISGRILLGTDASQGASLPGVEGWIDVDQADPSSSIDLIA